MSCAYTSEIFSLGADPAASALLERHAATCPDCGPALTALRSAAKTLNTFQPSAALGARARIWRGIEQGGPRAETPRWVWPLGASALAAGALVAVVIGRPSAAPQPTLVAGEVRLLDADPAAAPAKGLPKEAWVKTSKASTMDLGSATLQTKVGSIVRLAEVAPGNLELRLFRGDAALTVDRLTPTDVLMVTTRQARIQAFSSRVLLQATDRETVVEVQDGRVLVYREGETKPVMLLAGQVLRVAAAAGNAAVSSAVGDSAAARNSAAGDLAAAGGSATAGSAGAVVAPATAPIAPIATEPVALTEPLAAAPTVLPAKAPRSPPVATVTRSSPSPEPAPPVAVGSAAPEVPAAPPAPASGADSAAQLSRARKALESDAPKAAELATEVLSARPDAKMEVAALLVLADAQRRRGATQDAAELYARVARLPAASAFAEEAWLQSASLLNELGDRGGALAALAQADAKYSDGPLAPERARLEADIQLRQGHVEAAVRALKRAAQLARAKGDETSARAFEARATAIAPQ